MNLLSMTPAALLLFLTLATQHGLTEEETRAAVRLACGQRCSCVSLADVEAAIANVRAARMAYVAA